MSDEETSYFGVKYASAPMTVKAIANHNMRNARSWRLVAFIEEPPLPARASASFCPQCPMSPETSPRSGQTCRSRSDSGLVFAARHPLWAAAAIPRRPPRPSPLAPRPSPLARLRCPVSLSTLGDCRGRYADRSREMESIQRDGMLADLSHPADPTAIVGDHGPSGLQVRHRHGLLAPVPILVVARHRRPTDAQIGGLDPHLVVDRHVDPGMAQRGPGSVGESGGRHAGVAKRGPTRRSPSAFASWPTSSRAPRPNFSGGAP
jgi:hypothetical protein